MTKGRKPHLSDEEAKEVRALWRDRAGRWKVSALARAFNVSASVINSALNETGAYATPSPAAPLPGAGAKLPPFCISESFRLVKKAGSQYHYLAEDYDFAINAIAINARNMEFPGAEIPDWIGVEVTDALNPPFDWFRAVFDLHTKLLSCGDTRLAEMIEIEIFEKSRNHPLKNA